jgi:hypothetical protein
MKAKRWIVRGQDTESAASRVLGISPILAALLITCGCDNDRTARAFLTPSYDQLHNPSLMLGQGKGCRPFAGAIDKPDQSIQSRMRALIEVAGCRDGKGMTA